jgi:hypothetical protein
MGSGDGEVTIFEGIVLVLGGVSLGFNLGYAYRAIWVERGNK